MSLALIMPGRDTTALQRRLARELADVDLVVWPEIDTPEAVTFAVLWKQPPGCLATLPNLRAVLSYGAGVDFIVQDETVPDGLEIGRITDATLARQVASYLLAVVLGRARELSRYRRDQERGVWNPASEPVWPAVGFLGLGGLGGFGADLFASLGCRAMGWRRSGERRPGVTVFSGRTGLYEMAAQCDYLISTLPLTDETRGLLDRRLFDAMPPHGVLINVGRGPQLVEADLLAALDNGELAEAVLDVFDEEPLPAEHPFWHHPKVTITPHVAGLTDPDAAARAIAADYRTVMSGQGVAHPVNRALGY